MNVALQEKIDVKEDVLFELDNELLNTLLKDRSSDKNILWAVNDYESYGIGFSSNDFITVKSITGKYGNVIKPRIQKTKEELVVRMRQKAEVFTPSWICNKQNNLIDNAWFNSTDIFNKETDNGWVTNIDKVVFSNKKGQTWQEYVALSRMEITCGEAPYLVSRYDVVSGEYITPMDRIGLLDRKLRVISENVTLEEMWLEWATIAVQNIYGYDWQGDNVLLARENLLYTVIEYYEDKFKKAMPTANIKEFAHIISWNIWQMDGLKFVIPNSCIGKDNKKQLTLFSFDTKKPECMGCKNNLPLEHSGIYCKIMDWKKNKEVRYVDLIYGAKAGGK